jgi:hypothetical protein
MDIFQMFLVNLNNLRFYFFSFLKDNIFEAVYRLSSNKIDWSNWPEKFEAAALTKFFEDFNVSKEINQLIIQETKYKNDLREYNNWLHWKENRNVERKKTEIDFGWDVKHGNHLIRLMRTGCELLEGKGLIVKRPDANELLAIRNGEWTYEQLKAEFDRLNERLEFLYKNTKLPKSVNYEKINELYHEICNRNLIYENN